MGIENAKLVACPIKTIPKERVLEEIKKVLEPVFKIVASAVSCERAFNIPVTVSGAEDGECIVNLLLSDEDGYTRVMVPSEEEVEALVKAELSNHLWGPEEGVEYYVDYDFDGDFFDLVVVFESVEPDPVGVPCPVC
jgi:hypothetical protein